MRSRHVFDDTSVLNPVTGRPYGPGPLWAGTEPMDYPDPRCVCGALWLTGEGDRCELEGTFTGDRWSAAQAIDELVLAIHNELTAARRRLSVHIEPRDLWVGVYVAPQAVYVCPLPTLVIRWRRSCSA